MHVSCHTCFCYRYYLKHFYYLKKFGDITSSTWIRSPVDAEDFAVVITYEKCAPVEGESFYTGLVSYKTSIEKGQSFVFVDSSWKDMSDSDMENLLKTDFEPGNCCIKALFME